MADTVLARLARSRGRDLRRSIGTQLFELREERELSLREVGAAVGVDPSYPSRAEAGDANLTLGALAAIATALGTEASLRLFPATGPRLRDHLQVRLIETLLRHLDPRWRPRLEVPVYRPARGVIDLVLTEPGRARSSAARRTARSGRRSDTCGGRARRSMLSRQRRGGRGWTRSQRSGAC